METLQRTANRGSISTDTSYNIDNSLMFATSGTYADSNSRFYHLMNPGGDDNWAATSTNGTNARKVTVSIWFKRTALTESSHYPRLFDYRAGGVAFSVYINDSDKLKMYDDNTSMSLESNMVFRELNGWYHLVVAVDQTQSTASNRVKVYLNGEQITSWGTEDYGNQNVDLSCFRADSVSFHVGGAANDAGAYFNGYIAEYNFIDGQQLAPTEFGETDSDSGIWIPKEFTGSYGILGHYYNFSNASSIGEDFSGNDNDANNRGSGITNGAARQATDTPTNNFCTLAGHTYVGNQYGRYVQRHKEALTQTDEPTGSMAGSWGSHSFSSGKWYWESTSDLVTSANMHSFGVASCKNCSGPEDEASGFHTAEASFGLYPNANAGIYPGTGSTTSYKGTTGSSANDNLGANSDGSVWQIAFDADAGKIWFGKNDTWQNTIGGTSVSKSDIAAGNNARYEDLNDDAEGPWMPVFGTYNANEGHHIDVNFGGFTTATISSGNTDQNGFGNFEYAPPTGFLAICSENLKSINSIDDPSEHFQVETYTGGGSNSTVTFSGNSDLQPDFLWIKNRTSGYGHNLFDTNRGIAKLLESNNTNVENTNQTWISSVGSDSFTIGVNEQNLSNSSASYAAWAWKANGGTTSSNSSGDITSTVQANTNAGFSIVTYTGNFTGTQTVGHGLGVIPDLVIIKNRDTATDWVVWSPQLSSGNFLKLNTNVGEASSSRIYQSGFTTTTFGIGANNSVNKSGDDIVAYCFAEKEGYSIFGKFHGNGFHNTAGTYPVGKDGPFIHTGFRPALIFIKRIDNTGSWTVYDAKRDGYNNANDALFWNSDAAEASGNISGSNIDIYSNGFKVKSADNTVNASGAIYLYGAWAAQPQQTSSGIPATAR